MQTIVLLATLVAAALAIPSETYDLRYDNFDSDEAVKNTRLLENYLKCWDDKGPCVKEAADIKEKMPEALKTNCAKCTPKQKQHIRTIGKASMEKFPELWAELVEKLDPKGEYKQSFQDFLNATD